MAYICWPNLSPTIRGLDIFRREKPYLPDGPQIPESLLGVPVRIRGMQQHRTLSVFLLVSLKFKG
jgi:hypothetical protein